MNLSELIDTHRGARSYAELARDCGGAPSDKRLQQIVRSNLKNFPDPPTIKALARGLRVPESEVVLAAAESLGLDVRRGVPRLVELLPANVEALTEEQAAAIAHLVRVFAPEVGPRAVPDPVDEPTVATVLAAQRRAAQGAGVTPLAARSGVRQRSITDEAQNQAGEENQDDEGFDGR